MAQSRRWIQFLHGDLSNGYFPFPCCRRVFSGSSPLLENRWRLFLIGEAAALVLVIFGLYALSGAGSIRRLPLLRLGLIGISSLFLLRGLFFILSVLAILGILEGKILIQGEILDPGIPGNGNRVCDRDCFELERYAGSPVT